MKRLVIRAFTEGDLDSLYQLLSDKEVMQYIEPPFSKEKTKDFMKEVALINNPKIYAVEDLKNNFIGYIIYHPFDNESYEIGWIISKQYWGKGYAKELTDTLIEKNRSTGKDLVIECDSRQEVTKNIALKFGFICTQENESLCIFKRQQIEL